MPDTSLPARFPAIAAEWHPTRNGALIPNDVACFSRRQVFWRCRSCAHVWRASVTHRTDRGQGCPACAGRVATPKNSLRALLPTLAREWHPKANGELTPDQVVPGSNKVVAWRCARDPTHVWQAKVCKRAAGQGCPMCAGRVATPETSLRARFPELARQWHRAKNLPLTPDAVTPGSSRCVWWRCPRKRTHVWAAIISNRTGGGQGCPMCSGHVVTAETSLRSRFPEIARQWHPLRNEPLTPDDVTPGSGKRIWWVCPLDRAHVWQAQVVKRTKGRGCPFCAGQYGKKQRRR
jgi:hypothetical protein